jgi:hypothetical protein
MQESFAKKKQDSITNLCIPSNNTRIIFAHVGRIDHDTTQNTTHNQNHLLQLINRCEPHTLSSLRKK